MACLFCINFEPDKTEDNSGYSFEKLKNGTGSCTLNPKWEPTGNFHYCRHLEFKDPYLPGMWRLQLDERPNKEADLRKEIGRLKGVVKGLRAKLYPKSE